jgi:hypothetical protein
MEMGWETEMRSKMEVGSEIRGGYGCEMETAAEIGL